jgi:hypothetical protein
MSFFDSYEDRFEFRGIQPPGFTNNFVIIYYEVKHPNKSKTEIKYTFNKDLL